MRDTMASIITRKGQITIPIKYRRKLGLKIGQMMRFVYVYNDGKPAGLALRPITDFALFKGSFKSTKKYNKRLARKLYVRDVVEGRG